MNDLNIHIDISPDLYLQNPDNSELGRRIISASIELINELGFEAFTIKKLGENIGSPESTIYRYFANKHMILVYLTCWYWSWIEYKLVYAIANIKEPKEKLKNSINLLTQKVEVDHSFSYVNEVLLSEIIITEAVKSYHTKNVDKENEKGYFNVYKRVIQMVSNIVLEVNPKYEFPNMLISTVVEGIQQQRYFVNHLPSLTDIDKKGDNISRFYAQLVFNAIQ